jgi:hypothetical protein
MAMMLEGEQFKVLPTDPFFAAITGRVLKGELSLSQPAAEGFGINAEAPTGVGNRDHGHGVAPFGKRVEQEHATQRENVLLSQENSWDKRTMILGTDAPDGLLRPT